MVSHELTTYFSDFYHFFWLNEMAILLKAHKPDNTESHNSLKLSFTNIRGLRSNFVGCESSLNQTLLTLLLYVDKHGWLNWFWQFFYEGISSFNPKGFCYSYACSCSLHEEETSFFNMTYLEKTLWIPILGSGWLYFI